MLNQIDIPVRGLKQGRHSFKFEIDGEFFKGYGNTQILDAGCTVRAEVVRHQTIMKVNCLVSGFVVTQCDRCLEDLVLKVDFEREMTVGFGAVELEGTGAEEDVVLIDPTQGELNINQFIYDYVCLSLPIVKVHPEGKCNPDVEKYLSGDGSAEGPAADTPFSNLEEILKDKNN